MTYSFDPPKYSAKSRFGSFLNAETFLVDLSTQLDFTSKYFLFGKEWTSNHFCFCRQTSILWVLFFRQNFHSASFVDISTLLLSVDVETMVLTSSAQLEPLLQLFCKKINKTGLRQVSRTAQVLWIRQRLTVICFIAG